MEDKFDGFTVNLYLDEDGDWIAHFLELPNISAFADTPEQALKELAIAWEGVKESYCKHGEAVPVAPARRELVVSLMCASTSGYTGRWR